MSRFLDRLHRADHFVLVARFSLVLAVINARDELVVMSVTAAAAVVLIPRAEMLRRPWPWFAIGGLLAIAQALQWWRIDDHVVVTTYWLLAVGISRVAGQPSRFLSLSARLLVGLVFAFAFGWKLLSSQYNSAEFFRYELLFDDRFVLVSEHVAGNAPADLDWNASGANELAVEGEADHRIELREGPHNAAVATTFTWWGLLIEGATAAAFLIPLRGRALYARDATLLAFAGTTYLVVPVSGFGALLMALGLAHHDTTGRRTVYTFAFGALLVWGGIFPLLI